MLYPLTSHRLVSGVRTKLLPRALQRGKLAQKTDMQYNFSVAWFGKEKEGEKKMSGKETENDKPTFSSQNWREKEARKQVYLF